MSTSVLPRRQGLAGVIIAVLVFGLGAARAGAQTTSVQTPPPTQDEQLRRLLALGIAAGCSPLLELPATATNEDVATRLKSLGTQIGNELRAICGPSAVASASSLGGGLSTLQATKTVTQFNLARRRIDQRVAPKPPVKPSRDGRPAWSQAGVASPSLSAVPDPRAGVGVFGDVEFDRRDRIDTNYESGYESDVRSMSIGVDYVRNRTVVGGFVGRTEQSADFTRFGALLGGAASSSLGVLGQPGVLTSVCGGLADGGTFEQRVSRLGAFVGQGVGSSGFVDVTFGWARREHEYARSVCAIELPSSTANLTFTGGVLSDSTLPNSILDDIYAGTLQGLSTVHDTALSFRAGGDVGNGTWSFGPRVVFTYLRAAADPYTEAGRSTVANTVVPATPAAGDALPIPVTRKLGGPIGMELAFDAQTRTSLRLEAGAEVSARAGRVVPHVAGYWRREFNDDYHVLTAHFAQDLRPSPLSFPIGNDPFDSNSFVFAFGATVLGGDRVSARFELSRLASDALFSSQIFSAQVRAGF